MRAEPCRANLRSTCGACGGLKPLPSLNGQPNPAPLGLPTDQVIEGGIQARITKPGMDKLLGREKTLARLNAAAE